MKQRERIHRVSDSMFSFASRQVERLESRVQEQESAYRVYKGEVHSALKEYAPVTSWGLDRFKLTVRVRRQREENGKPHIGAGKRIHWTDRALVELKKEGLADWRVDRTGRFGKKRDVWYSLQPKESSTSTK